jgi:hypothetical protein
MSWRVSSTIQAACGAVEERPFKGRVKRVFKSGLWPQWLFFPAARSALD